MPFGFMPVVAAAGGGRLAIAGGIGAQIGEPLTLLTSDDGQQWEPVAVPDSTLRAEQLALGDDGSLVLLGSTHDDYSYTALTRSADGTWSVMAFGPDLRVGVPPVLTATAAGYLLAGAAPDGSGSVSGTWYSPDGRAWRQLATPMDGSFVATFLGVPGGVLAFASDPGQAPDYTTEAYGSTDGATWDAEPRSRIAQAVGGDVVTPAGEVIAWGCLFGTIMPSEGEAYRPMALWLGEPGSEP